MAGLTLAGFVAKRSPEIKLDLEQKLQDRFGAVNLNPQSVFGQLVGLMTETLSDVWATTEDVYSSQYPRGASGVNLDRVASINGLIRLSAAPTAVRGVITGVIGTTLIPGRLVSSTDLTLQFTLLEGITLSPASTVGTRISVATVANSTNYTITIGGTPHTYNSGGSATAASILAGLAALFSGDPAITATVTSGADGSYIDLAYDTQQSLAITGNLHIDTISTYASFAATIPGPLDVPIGSLNQIDTPVSGWTGIANRQAGTPGRTTETDTDLRVRREKSLRLAAIGTLDAIVSNLQQVPGVLEQRVLANNTNSTDGNSIPAHSIWAIVDGGTNADIAQVLFAKVPAGIGMKGSVSVDVISNVTNSAYTVKFDRPTNTNFYVEVTIVAGSDTPTNAIELVRNALVDWAHNELQIGDNVYRTRLFSPINEVIGKDGHISLLYLNTVPIVDVGTRLTADLTATAAQRYVIASSGIQVFVV